jgi:hypothetical protein
LGITTWPFAPITRAERGVSADAALLGCLAFRAEQRPGPATPGRIDVVIDRAQVAASVAGSLRLEGLEPTGPVRELGDCWVRGDASDADLREAERRLLAGESLEGLPASAAANGASRHV